MGGYTGMQRFVRTFSPDDAAILEQVAKGETSKDLARHELKANRLIAESHNRFPDNGEAIKPTSLLVTEEQVGKSKMDHVWASRCGFPDPVASPNAFTN
ncbi:hypothetical protein C1707_23445 [Caulobacter flavus]|nr:hypothetical protein C1707_23445 [Caulobacter flavus]